MHAMQKQITIAAPAKKIVDFISDPKNMAIVIPHVIRNFNLSKGKPRAGFKFDWEFAMMGLPFKGKWTITEYDYPKKYVGVTEGMIKSTWTYSFSETAGKTTWKASVDYEIPKKVMGKFAEPTVRKINEKDLGRFLHNVKVLLEQ